MNEIRLAGVISRVPKSGGEGDKAWCFFSLRTTEERPTILDVASFGDTAREAAKFCEGDEIKILGRVGSKKDKTLTEGMKRDVWVMQVVATKRAMVKAAKPADDMDAF